MEVEQNLPNVEIINVEKQIKKRKKYYPNKKKEKQDVLAESILQETSAEKDVNEPNNVSNGVNFVKKYKKQFYFGRKKNVRLLNRRYRQLNLNYLDFPAALRLQFEVSYDKIFRNGEKRNGGKVSIDIFDIIPIKNNSLEKMNEYLMLKIAKKENNTQSTIDLKDLPRVEFRFLESVKIVPVMIETNFEGTDELHYSMRSTYLLDKERYFFNKKGMLRLSRVDEAGVISEKIGFSKEIKIQFDNFTYDYLNELVNSFEGMFKFH